MYGTVSGCRRATLIILHAHFSVSLFFSVYSLVMHKNHPSGLRAAVVLIAFEILSRRSGIGTSSNAIV